MGQGIIIVERERGDNGDVISRHEHRLFAELTHAECRKLIENIAKQNGALDPLSVAVNMLRGGTVCISPDVSYRGEQAA